MRVSFPAKILYYYQGQKKYLDFRAVKCIFFADIGTLDMFSDSILVPDLLAFFLIISLIIILLNEYHAG